MLTKTYGAAVSGIDAIVVTMEVSIENGMGFCFRTEGHREEFPF